MIPRDCKPIGHIPPLPRIDLNPPRSIAQVPRGSPFHSHSMEAMAQGRRKAEQEQEEGRRKAEQDRIWRLIKQSSEGA